jgi:feruloyl esterase
MVTGWSDPVFSASDLTAYYDRLTADTKRRAAMPPFARLFMVPGMTHCGGGLSRRFRRADLAGALGRAGRCAERFRRQGQGVSGVERPICAYPTVARYDGKGPLIRRQLCLRCARANWSGIHQRT